MHAVLQHIRFDACADVFTVKSEVERLLTRKLLSREQADMVDCKAIAALFGTEIGMKLRSGISCIREFKFSILDEGSHYGDGLQEEQVLLQGVVDCAMMEDDGITVIDFKTDRVTTESLPVLMERYRPQVQTYVQALERIYRKPVKQAYLYFFGLNQFIAIK